MPKSTLISERMDDMKRQEDEKKRLVLLIDGQANVRTYDTAVDSPA